MSFCFLCGESLMKIAVEFDKEKDAVKHTCVCSKCSAVWHVVMIFNEETIDYSLQCTDPNYDKIIERMKNENRNRID